MVIAPDFLATVFMSRGDFPLNVSDQETRWQQNRKEIEWSVSNDSLTEWPDVVIWCHLGKFSWATDVFAIHVCLPLGTFRYNISYGTWAFGHFWALTSALFLLKYLINLLTLTAKNRTNSDGSVFNFMKCAHVQGGPPKSDPQAK